MGSSRGLQVITTIYVYVYIYIYIFIYLFIYSYLYILIVVSMLSVRDLINISINMTSKYICGI